MKPSYSKLTIASIDLLDSDHIESVERSVVLIKLNDGRLLFRWFGSFLQDLKNSYLVSPQVDSPYDEGVMDVIRDLQDEGTLTGMVEFYKAGSKYKLDEHSSAITNPDHRLYGEVSVGDTLKRDKDGSNVDGFLVFNYSADHKLAVLKARAYGKASAKPTNLFASYATPKPTASEEVPASAVTTEEIDSSAIVAEVPTPTPVSNKGAKKVAKA